MNESINFEATDADIEKKAEGARIFNFRHSKAMYGAYAQKLASESPQGNVDIESQPLDDLTPEGHELARTQSEAFFGLLDPQKDSMYIVSSDQTRALQTASIYAQTALAKGFNVMSHNKTGTGIAATIGKGYVRSIEGLSLNYGDSLADSVFNPPKALPEINWKAVPPEEKEKWDKARAIVLADDKGSWGANLFAHSAKVKEIFPDMRSSADLHDRQFENLLRLAAFAKKKAGNERVNILSFGHENYMGTALEMDTGNHALPNCEGVELKGGKLVRIKLD